MTSGAHARRARARFPGRYFRQTLVTTAHHANADGGIGENDVNWIIEQVSGTMQLGTHIDALSHLQIGGRGYNGWTVGELAGTAGVKRLGAETIPQIVTRGWLVDVPAVRGVERLERGEVITVEDVEKAGVAAEPGDAVLFHTGWGAHWEDPDAYVEGEPGPGLRGRQLAGLARRRAHRLRHVELRAGARREPGVPVRGSPDPERPPRRVRGREPRHAASWPPTVAISSR